MMTFKEFIDPANQPTANPDKKWKASKEEIINYWKGLRPDTPIQMQPIEYNHKGSTYDQDGIRITGTPQFITSTLARLKEILSFENQGVKLSVTYRETESPSNLSMGQSKTSYVFYVSTRKRGQGK